MNLDESFPLKESPEGDKNEDVLQELENINAELSSSIKPEEIIFENTQENKFDAPVRDILRSIRETVLQDDFISAEYNNPMHKELIEAILLKKTDSIRDNSLNSWRVKLGELFDKNDEEGMIEFKSKATKLGSEKIIDEINEIINSDPSNH